MPFYHQESLAEQASWSLQSIRSDIELCDTLLLPLPFQLFGLTWQLPASPAKPPAASLGTWDELGVVTLLASRQPTKACSKNHISKPNSSVFI
jgi:hypothetical protein